MSFDYSMTSADESSIIAVFLMAALFYLIALAFAIVCYVFESLGMYTIAKRRTIKHPWLAWIPVANLWILGCISDQYKYVAKGKVTNRRKILLALGIVTLVLVCVLVGCYVNVIAQVFLNIDRLDYMSDAQAMNLFLPSLAGIFCVLVIMFVVAIVQLVFQYMSLYDLYTSCDPKNNVLFLVLSILFNVVTPFFLFACRKKDLGMPPRKQEIPEQSWQTPEQPTWQPVQNEPKEPWEQ